MVMEANTQAPTQPTHIIDINLACGIVIFYDGDYINAPCIEFEEDDWNNGDEMVERIYTQVFELWGLVTQNYEVICEDVITRLYYLAWHRASLEPDDDDEKPLTY
jgi:hypothetical protein